MTDAGPLAAATVMPFVTCSDPERAKAFYGATLGLALRSEDGFGLVFATGGVVLRVAISADVQSAPYTVLGWNVPDIGAGVAALRAAGVEMQRFPGMDQDADGIWHVPGGARVAWFRDPDGNLLSLTQPPPSEGVG